MFIYGIHAVREALRADRVQHLLVAHRHDPRVRALIDQAASRGVAVEQVTREALDRWSHGEGHQGVVAKLGAWRIWSVADLVRGAAGVPLIVVLDGIEDPQNVGAILRSCDAAGADGVIRQTRRAAPLEGAVSKASAGAVAHVRVADVVNIARAIEELKTLGVWTVGLAGDAERSYDSLDLTVSLAFVLGAEGSGLRRLVRESCDWVTGIPMHGHVDSLNVSVAAGVVLFEARRQRRGAAARAPDPGGSRG